MSSSRTAALERVDFCSTAQNPSGGRIMRSALRLFVHPLAAVVLVTAIAIPQNLAAQATQHLVSPDDLEKAAVDASQARQQNLDTLNSFLSSDQAQKAIESAHMNPQEVKTAVSGLSDEELAQLATRASKAQSDFAAGSIGDRDLIFIVLAIVVLILLIAIFH
jgi:hypothetical protein